MKKFIETTILILFLTAFVFGLGWFGAKKFSPTIKFNTYHDTIQEIDTVIISNNDSLQLIIDEHFELLKNCKIISEQKEKTLRQIENENSKLYEKNISLQMAVDSLMPDPYKSLPDRLEKFMSKHNRSSTKSVP